MFFPFAAPSAPRSFNRPFSCFSMAVSGKAHLEDGDKILLPPSALHELAQMNVEYPMLFELTNPRMSKRTHCGVLEFSAENGRCYIPFWMMQNLMIQEGDILNVKNVSLRKAKFVKFRPQSVDFINISNPRAVLEKSLRKYTCVTEGDQICIPYLSKNYYLEIREVQPDGAASIVETDCNVDFDEPVGYQESLKASKVPEKGEVTNHASARPMQRAVVDQKEPISEEKAVAFSGTARRVDGKPIKAQSGSIDVAPPPIPSPTPSTAVSSVQPTIPGRISSIGDKYSKKKSAVSAFTGQGYTLK